ncbi:U-box domain-containing protein 45-like isoform X2 [Andrographis paniculata]|uniref:U-box domain-containing protein 45-like isoform X2 n=1 Tax=Andrographis paniculata TaxID=175694 RepID=UPI0021E83284|nr:U-box domain-containing protein 45-like isoform X2 [Andrographis paniculata]XP_051116188.1 U-box domain-containing protein 45-like isoform X2 [Andrographis paniculata]XP_051116189.1 U-box domain-containing protein 45-like isoform X2 [Andrographis paniculata]XP_051116191.1 U-box domain-containing protein 45-like isoform X2 [Andrographis paniculata]
MSITTMWVLSKSCCAGSNIVITLNMDISEIEENLLSIGEPKLHSEMCKSLCVVYIKVLVIFPNLEAARPRSTSGIQALCALHIALEKTKNILRHCAECSKLYLAITGDSVVLKFEKARCALEDSLHRVEDIVPQAISGQIAEILIELGGIDFSLDPVEKQIGDEVIALFQHGRNFKSSGNSNELQSFHQAACKLGITSSRAALRERRALKKLIERAQAEEDKRKESIIAYLQHLMKKYSKLFRSEFSDDNDSQGSTPCSPSLQGLGHSSSAFDRKLLKLGSYNMKSCSRRSDQMPIPPEELRCPISLQLMYDPVIIASGQTYERVCIEKWFGDGHSTCPKTQQQLPHRFLTTNFCVKGLVASWCEQNGIPIPDGPPESLDLNYWRLVLSETDSASSKLVESVGSCKCKGGGVKDLLLTDDDIIEEVEGNEAEDNCEVHEFQKYEDLLKLLRKEDELVNKCKMVEQIGNCLIDDEDARTYMGANGFVEELLCFLGSAVSAGNRMAQEIGVVSLVNLALNSKRNKELMMSLGVLPVLQKMIADTDTDTDTLGAAASLYSSLSVLADAKPIIGASEAVPFLIRVLQSEVNERRKLDVLHALYNIASHPSNIPHLVSSGIIDGLRTHVTANPTDPERTEKCIGVLIYLASSSNATRDKITKAPGMVSSLATLLDTGEPIEQEQAATCLLKLCNGNEACSQMVLEEGAIPALVSISVNGTVKGKQKAHKLLMLFRDQRQRDSSSTQGQVGSEATEASSREPKPSQRKVWSFWRKAKSKSLSAYQC